MVEQASPLGDAYRPGSHGNLVDGAGVVITETRPGSIVEVAAWPGQRTALLEAIRAAISLDLGDRPGAGAMHEERSGFGIGPGRLLLVDEAEGLAQTLANAVGNETGTVTDLSHGRTAIRVEGDQAEWVLSKLFPIHISPDGFPVGEGRATAHHDISAAIQRTGAHSFDIYVFRSFARSFWKVLCHSAEEVGYEIR
ncbi:sarcosine oxidase subunit gamma family protein [Neoaquamicrobium sediminum]|uniref:Sarcosine oxidase subunit gamma family protein n=1 Tax=Neoaquamicrobium sediminum TaxID=1849104 RepID=A0ABV3WZY1_9HYPH